MFLVFILTLSIISGQLAKLPFLSYGGITFLDVVVLGLVIWHLIKIRILLNKPPLFIQAGLLFIAISLISLILTPLHLIPVEYATSLFYIFRFSIFLIFGWLLYQKALFSQKNDLELVLLFSGIGLACLGILQLIFFPSLQPIAADGWDPHVDRVVSTFLDPNFLAGYLTLTLVMIYLNPGHILKGKIRIGLFILVYLAFVGTFSRGGYLMFCISFAFLSLLLKSVKTALVSVLLILGLLGGYYIYKVEVANPKHVDRNQSANLRISSWEQGSNIFFRNPVLGVGFNAYRYALSEYHIASSGQIQSRGATSNDSSILFVAATTGTVGLVTYLTFLYSFLYMGWKLYREKNVYGTMILVSIIGLASQSFFSNLLFYPFILLWIFSLPALAKSRD